MMSMASDVGRSPLIALRSIGHAERTTAQSIAAANVTASPGRLTAGNQLRSPSVPTGMFMNTFTGWGDGVGGQPNLRQGVVHVVCAAGVARGA